MRCSKIYKPLRSKRGIPHHLPRTTQFSCYLSTTASHGPCCGVLYKIQVGMIQPRHRYRSLKTLAGEPRHDKTVLCILSFLTGKKKRTPQLC